MQSRASTYRLLARNQWIAVRRAITSGPNVYIRSLLILLTVYFAFSLTVSGWRFGIISRLVLNQFAPINLLNDYLLTALFSLFGIRFLFGKNPRFKFLPYKHLPIKRSSLISFFQLSSLGTLHNLLPLCFIGAFWIRHILPSQYPAMGIAFWITALVMLLVAATWLNTWLRLLLSNHTKLFVFLLLTTWVLIAVDQFAGTYVINEWSHSLFTNLLLANKGSLLVVVLAAVTAYGLSSAALLDSFHKSDRPRTSNRRLVRSVQFLDEFGLVGSLITLELKMMWRNRRPRHNVLLSVLFSTVYLCILLITTVLVDNVILLPIIGLFASGGLALNYGQLMFSWDSSFFEGLSARDIDSATFVRSKYLLLQLSCVGLFVVSLPVFWVLRPDLLLMHVAFMLYNVGVTTALVMYLAVHNRSRVELDRSGNFFNYEGFSVVHWLWILPTSVPPVALMLYFRDSPLTGFLVIGIVGGVAALLTRFWNDYLAVIHHSRRYKTLIGFRG
ncbi:MAG: hypothetical protein HKN13_03345 [Rhodothermales bacterium]|nr:hypothetical protein [Rhodothermales bacterium]